MGRPTVQPGNSIRHFSHPHPLQLSASDPRDGSSSCDACKLKLAGLQSYSCSICVFHLHAKCADMPRKIKHPFDKIHLLSLVPSPQYEEGRFRCDACGKDGDGFSYHCGDCGIDLHTVCANMPSRVSHQSHPQHELYLTFFIPHDSGSFCCRICRGTGSNSWLYRCKACGFDAHLICARKKIGQTSQANSPSNWEPSSNPAPNISNYINRPNPPQVVCTPLFPGQANINPIGPSNAATPTVDQIIGNALANSSSTDPNDQVAEFHDDQWT